MAKKQEPTQQTNKKGGGGKVERILWDTPTPPITPTPAAKPEQPQPESATPTQPAPKPTTPAQQAPKPETNPKTDAKK